MLPAHKAQFGAFSAACYEHVGRAMKEMADDPRAKAFPRDVMVTALAMACIRAGALSLTASEISMEDVEFLAGTLTEEVKRMRQSAADKGLIRRQQ